MLRSIGEFRFYFHSWLASARVSPKEAKAMSLRISMVAFSVYLAMATVAAPEATVTAVSSELISSSVATPLVAN